MGWRSSGEETPLVSEKQDVLLSSCPLLLPFLTHSAMLCRLCNLKESIENSHVIPRLVFRSIKSDSPTGFLRSYRTPNRRVQDGDKQPLLCQECENRFSIAEKEFAQNIFVPFHKLDQDHFSYGPWLHYFLTSLAWRTLVLDLPGFEADPTITPSLLEPLQASLRTMQSYLRGAAHASDLIRHHMIVWTAAQKCSPELASIGPNVLIRRSTVGYALINKRYGHAAVVHNMAGIIAVLNIKGNPRDNWLNTKVNPTGGVITQPQNVASWVLGDLLDALMDRNRGISTCMSEKQREKILQELQSNSAAGSLRHAMRDALLRSTGQE